MKELISAIMICLSLNLNILQEAPQVFDNILEEGVYNAEDIINVLGNVTTIQNISTDKYVYFTLLDQNRTVIEAIKMKPSSRKFSLVDLQPGYKIILLGDGEAYLSK